jgi:hypothetical protein
MSAQDNRNAADDMRVQYAAFRLATTGSAVAKWILALLVFAFAPVYLSFNPNAYTPLVQVLLSLFLFLLAYWIGNAQETRRATQRANDRWLPQAESVILRLMTLRANVVRFSRTTKTNCGSATCELPELAKEEMRAVRIKLKTDCEASSQRLDDIAHQLDDAIEDWRRFVTANCQGEECNRIFEALQQREQKLLDELTQGPPVVEGSQGSTPVRAVIAPP